MTYRCPNCGGSANITVWPRSGYDLDAETGQCYIGEQFVERHVRDIPGDSPAGCGGCAFNGRFGWFDSKNEQEGWCSRATWQVVLYVDNDAHAQGKCMAVFSRTLEGRPAHGRLAELAESFMRVNWTAGLRVAHERIMDGHYDDVNWLQVGKHWAAKAAELAAHREQSAGAK